MNIDFVSKKLIWFIISAIIIALGVASLFVKGIHTGIEFTGGTVFDIAVNKQVDVDQLRTQLEKIGLQNPVVQTLGAKNEVLIRSESLGNKEQQEVVAKVDEMLGIKEVRYIQNVGPGWGQNITNAARIALILSLAALLLYISFRFEYKMAIAAIVALVHDIMITIGVYSIVGREVTPNTVAALLTILGYSLYDTVVVFHRIKENSSRIQRETYSQMVNRSINQVLVRSINTTTIMVIPVIALLTFGGETLKDFSFALLIGMLTGAYSSIFIASQIVAVWKESEPRYRSIRAKLGRA